MHQVFEVQEVIGLEIIVIGCVSALGAVVHVCMVHIAALMC